MGVTSTLSYQSLHREFQVFIGFLIIPRQCSWVPSSSYKSSVTPSRVARSPNHSVWVQRLLQHLQQGGGINDIKTMLASMKISSTISPFFIDDNNSCSPYEHAPLLSASLPLWHQWKRVSTYLCLKSLITTYFSPYQYA